MKKIFIYKNAHIGEEIIFALKKHFPLKEFVSYDTFHFEHIQYEIIHQNIFLINLSQIREMDKIMTNMVINHIDSNKFILLINADQIQIVNRLLKTGILGLILEDDPIELIIDAIDNIEKYGGYVSPRLMKFIHISNENLINKLKYITIRERQILMELLNGKSDKMIAHKLNISYQTIKTHRKKLYQKLNVKSQGELFALMT